MKTLFKKIRTKQELSQLEMAQKLKVSQALLSAIETGFREPSLTVCMKMIKRMDISSRDRFFIEAYMDSKG